MSRKICYSTGILNIVKARSRFLRNIVIRYMCYIFIQLLKLNKYITHILWKISEKVMLGGMAEEISREANTRMVLALVPLTTFMVNH